MTDLTPMVLAGIRASGGVSVEEVVKTPRNMHGDGLKADAIIWFRKADGKTYANTLAKLEALGEGAALGRLESADLGLRGVGRPQTDLVGRVYGGWTVVNKYRDGAGYKGSRWTIKHACGYETTRIGQKLAHSEPTRCQNCGKR